jgi:hypothetical protein
MRIKNMKVKILLFATVVFCCFLAVCTSSHAQGTAFTYQGQVMSSNSPAHGTYDLTFKLWNASSAGAQVGGTITASSTVITNGLFTVVLDFGSQYNGTSYWLELAVRTNGAVSFATLSPRQQLTPTPYAVFAEGGNAAGLTGTVPASDLSGTYGNALTLNNAGNLFAGNGAGLTGVNALTLGGLGAANFWQLGGNVGTTPGVNYLGTPDNQALEIHVNGARGFRVEPDSIYSTPNVIGGSAANYVAPGWVGNFIGAGGQAGFASNYITGGHLNVIGGGWDNHSTNNSENVIAGGYYNIVAGGISSIGGGYLNTVLGYGGTVPGGYNNLASGQYSFAAGQNAQALHDGAFVWADNSSSTPFVSTANNQFLVRSSFVGINRATRVSGAEYFGILAPVTNAYGGMYIQTRGPGLPFYGYADGSGYAWTYLDGLDANKWKLYNGGSQLTFTTGGNLGISTTVPSQALDVNGEFAVVEGYGGEQAYMGGDGLGNDVQFGSLNIAIDNVAFYNAAKSTYMHIYCSSITILGGADLAEPFKITSGDKEIPPGTVVVIDDRNPGHLKMSDQAYDTRVAGVVSGANGVNPGVEMQQQGVLEGGKNVALTGRVYVQADAANGAIQPGDLLTTSSTPGEAMKVTDHTKAAGAILGKAMTGLSEGRGLVLVLVTLQ